MGKAATPREEWPHHYGHEEKGVPLVHAFCSRIRAPKSYERAGKIASLVHMKAGKIGSLRPGSKIKMFSEIQGARSISYRGIEILARVDSKDDTIEFARIAEEVMKIGATEEQKEKINVPFVQKKHSLGYGRIARVFALMEDAKLIGPSEKGKRPVLVKNIEEIKIPEGVTVVLPK